MLPHRFAVLLLLLSCHAAEVFGFSPSFFLATPGSARHRGCWEPGLLLSRRSAEARPPLPAAARRHGLLSARSEIGGGHCPSESATAKGRRGFLVEGGLAAASILWLPGDSASVAAAEAANFPPVQQGAKRIFLCRHGETELNRLGKIQG